eukprot:COSAG06_NODE_20607_length_788_cov_1.226415_1_plen_107_part_00
MPSCGSVGSAGSEIVRWSASRWLALSRRIVSVGEADAVRPGAPALSWRRVDDGAAPEAVGWAAAASCRRRVNEVTWSPPSIVRTDSDTMREDIAPARPFEAGKGGR